MWFYKAVILAMLISGCATIGQQMKIDGSELLILCRNNVQKAKELRNNLIKDEALNTYNDILVEADSAISKAKLLSQVHPDGKIRKDAEVCEQEFSQFMTELSLDRKLYEILLSVDEEKLDEDAKRMLSRTLRDFRRAGVDKDDLTREKIKALKEELVIIAQEFSQNINKDRFVIELDSKDDLAGLPKDYIDSHKPNLKDKIEISTDYPDYIPFMKYAHSDRYRQELRFKNLNRAKGNEEVLKKLIMKRYELAKLLGYRTYAEYVAEDKMIKSASAIHDFIDKVAGLAKEGADKEFLSLLNFKKKYDKDAKNILGHESAYLEEGFKKNEFSFDSQEARNYFSYPLVKDGLLNLTSELFGLSYQKIEDIKLWHPSVDVYDVSDESGKLGRIYLDMHPREGKFKHAAQFTLLSGLKDRQYPEGVLVCNFPQPTMDDPNALMEHREVVTFFHEFGHLLHHIFAGKQKWIPFSGVATEWDFVEAPSQFFEEWAWSYPVLKNFAKHYQTREPIPEVLAQKMRLADEFGKALAARQQMFYAALSVNYYDQDPANIDLLEMLKAMQEKYSYYPYEKDTYFYRSFGHLDEYSAIYYTYGWSLSIAKDLLTPFNEKGLMNQNLARRYRETILNPGGSKDANDLILAFLGRPFQFDAYEKWLTQNPSI